MTHSIYIANFRYQIYSRKFLGKLLDKINIFKCNFISAINLWKESFIFLLDKGGNWFLSKWYTIPLSESNSLIIFLYVKMMTRRQKQVEQNSLRHSRERKHRVKLNAESPSSLSEWHCLAWTFPAFHRMWDLRLVFNFPLKIQFWSWGLTS